MVGTTSPRTETSLERARVRLATAVEARDGTAAAHDEAATMKP